MSWRPIRNRSAADLQLRATPSSTASPGDRAPLVRRSSLVQCRGSNAPSKMFGKLVITTSCSGVRDLAVERSTLPLLFFQGGYGKFSPGSFIAAPDPELIQACHAAETMRIQVEEFSVEVGVNCSVLARIRWDAVQVLAANHAPIVEPFPLGHRQPIIPPFGAVFMVNASDSDIDEWLGRAPDLSDERRALNRSPLERVRECGYSLLAAGSEVLQRHQAALSAFEQSDRLPRQQRVVQQVTSDLANFLFTG